MVAGQMKEQLLINNVTLVIRDCRILSYSNYRMWAKICFTEWNIRVPNLVFAISLEFAGAKF